MACYCDYEYDSTIVFGDSTDVKRVLGWGAKVISSLARKKVVWLGNPLAEVNG